MSSHQVDHRRPGCCVWDKGRQQCAWCGDVEHDPGCGGDGIGYIPNPTKDLNRPWIRDPKLTTVNKADNVTKEAKAGEDEDEELGEEEEGESGGEEEEEAGEDEEDDEL